MKTRHSKDSFALRTRWEVGTKPLTKKTYSDKPFTEVFSRNHVVLYCVKRSLHKRSFKLFTQAHCSQSHAIMVFQVCGSIATDSPLLLFTQYETCLTVISSH